MSQFFGRDALPSARNDGEGQHPMRADDLDHKELLELDPEGGVIRFAGQRALLLDAVAMGLLRKYLVENFGLTAARTVLTQFGFAHGWRMAEAMQAEFKWDSDDDWRRAGTRIHTLEGLFRVEPEARKPSPRRARCSSPRTRPSNTSCTSAAPTRRCAGPSAASRAATSAGPPARRSTCSRIAAWARATPAATCSGARARSGATSAPTSCASSSPTASRSASTSRSSASRRR